MKTKMMTLLSVMVLALAIMAVPAYAAAGGNPAAHGVSGADFGKAVSGLATTDPGALAAHASGGAAGGMPAAHGVSGADFGAAVSGLAQSAPGAVAEHVGK
jgi:hypothetical protein